MTFLHVTLIFDVSIVALAYIIRWGGPPLRHRIERRRAMRHDT